MLIRPDKKEAGPQERGLWGELVSLGMVFPIAITLGFFGGRWIGGWFGYPAVGQWIGLVYGIATGFYELYKTTKRLDRMDQQNPAEDPKDKP